MADILNSIASWFKERTTSPLYGTFVLSVILWNWKFFYVLFLQSEEKLSLSRIEYVQQNFLYQQDTWHHLVHFLILPLISTYIIIWWLPILSNWAYKKHADFYYKRRLLVDQLRLNYERREKETLRSISVVKKEQADAKKEIKKNTSEIDEWGAEFESFKNQPLYSSMGQLKNILYNYSGLTRKWNGSSYGLLISSDVLAAADSRGLISISGEDAKEKIELTPKGKFFMSKYLENR